MLKSPPQKTMKPKNINEIECYFCKAIENEKDIVVTDKYSFAKWDGHPVSKGHALIMPKRHAPTLFDLPLKEVISLYKLLKQVRAIIRRKYNPDGFNIGVNEGKAAGQTIFHLHIHIIPRYKGDVKHPEGGVRHVIPGKGYYRNKEGDNPKMIMTEKSSRD